MTNTSDEPTTSMTDLDEEPVANHSPSVDSGCPRCPRWKIDQRGRQYISESLSLAYISGVSTLSTLIHYLSRTWARVLRARLTHNSSRFTPDSVDTHTQKAENRSLMASTAVEGVHATENRSVDTVDTLGGWSR